MIFYGRNVVLESLNSNFIVRELIIQDNLNQDEKISSILALAKTKKVSIKYLSRKELTKLTKNEEHQGVISNVEFIINKLEISGKNYDKNEGYIYISESFHDHNIGAIIRSAECSGLNGVIIPKEVKISGAIAKASAGGLFHIPIFQESIYNVIKKFQDNSFSIYGIERNGVKYFDEDISGPCLFIIGGEDKSLSEGVREKCTNILEIPQRGKVNSLNMSVATSIILFERLEQQIKGL